MIRQSDFKKKYDPDMGKYTRQHIYGEGISDSFKSFSSKVLRKKTKKTVAPPAPRAKPSKKAGYEIV